MQTKITSILTLTLIAGVILLVTGTSIKMAFAQTNPPYENPPYENPPYENPPYENPPYENPPYENPP